MLLSRPAIAADPLHFGKRSEAPTEPANGTVSNALASDLRLFALTFAAGFLFVSVLIA
jgi:hypothetical protein